MTASPTTNEIAARERSATPQQFNPWENRTPVLPGLSAVNEWLTAAGQARQLAELLVRGAFVPDSYKPKAGDPESAWETAVQNATGAILLGQQLGVDPITALQQIVMVKGRPTMYAKFKVGLLTAHGHEVWDEELTEDRATVCGRRAGWPTDRLVRITITMEQAKRAGWTSNDTYTKTPADMLWARAAGRVCDRVASDVLFGLPSFADEVDDPGDVPAQSARVTAEQILSQPLPAAQPAATPLAAVLEHAERAPAAGSSTSNGDGRPSATQQPESERVDPQTLSAISARFRELGGSFGTGTGATAARRRVISSIVRRGVAKAADLTAEEARLVLDTLQGTTLERAEQVLADLPGPDLDDDSGDELPLPGDDR
jgi:hypothetical protein